MNLTLPRATDLLDRLLGRDGDPVVDRLLEAARRRLGVDAVYLELYRHDATICAALAGDGDRVGLAPGDVLDGMPTVAVVAGATPAVVPVTAEVDALRALAWQRVPPIGAMASAAVRTSDGRLHAGLAAVNATPVDRFDPAGVTFLWQVADVLAEILIEPGPDNGERDAVAEVLRRGAIRADVQPIVDLASGTIRGVEALARFTTDSPRRPDVWFAIAERHGLALPLEALAADRALALLDRLPGTCYLAVNASPQLILGGSVDELVDGLETDRVVVEVTEHARVDDYPALVAALARLRNIGVRVAVDDVGAGYASMRHVLELEPDIVKIDGSVIRGLDTDAAHRGLTEALVAFADRTGTDVVAEAVETPEEANTLRDLGVRTAQGWLYAAAGPVDTLRPSYAV